MNRERSNAWLFLPVLIGIFTVHAVRGSSWWLALVVAGAAVALTRDIVRRKATWRELVTWAGSVALFTHAFLSLVQLLQGADRAFGLASHPNLAAAASASLGASVLVASHGARSLERVPRRWFAVAVSLAALVSIVSSGSRSVLIGCALALVLAALTGRTWVSSRRSRLGAVLAASAMLAAVLVLSILGGSGEDGRLFRGFERIPIYSVALDMASLSPLVGLGDGAWSRWLPLVEPSMPLGDASHPHSVPLLVLIEGGTLGFVAVMMAVWHVSVSWIRRAPGFSSIRSLAIAVFLSGIAAQAFVDVTLLHPIVYGPLVLAGLGLPARADRERAVE